MAELQFDLVSPERRLASMQATSVLIPGAEGDMTVMADHAPTITTLRPGIVRVEAGGETTEFVVTGGFAEIGAQGISVLAEEAVSKADAAGDFVDGKVKAAQQAIEAAGEEGIDVANKLLADLEALRTEVA